MAATVDFPAPDAPVRMMAITARIVDRNERELPRARASTTMARVENGYRPRESTRRHFPGGCDESDWTMGSPCGCPGARAAGDGRGADRGQGQAGAHHQQAERPRPSLHQLGRELGAQPVGPALLRADRAPQ